MSLRPHASRWAHFGVPRRPLPAQVCQSLAVLATSALPVAGDGVVPQGWEKVPGGLPDISIGADGSVFGIGPDNARSPAREAGRLSF
jgi:hypothetical protein